MTIDRTPIRYQRHWRFRQPFLGGLPALSEDVRECPQLNPPFEPERLLAAMAQRVLHPGKAGALNTPLPSDADLRRRNSPYLSDRLAHKGVYR